MSWVWSSRRGRVLARAGIGVLGWVIPPDLVDEAVGDGLAWEMRLRALPSRLGVYFVLGCALLSGKPYAEVIRQVTSGVRRTLAAVGWRVPATTALTGVRRTTLTDWRAYPAAALAACYARRWAIETGYAEIKTCLRGPGRTLRGRTPDLARQELWAYLAIYQALRLLIARAAAGAGPDPGRISFTAALNAAQRTLDTDPGILHDALDAAETEMLSCLVPLRQGRICPRAVKQTRSPYTSRRSHPGPITQHAEYTVTITVPDRSAETTTDQAKQPAQHPGDPPLNS
jgi:hypothetical protein